MRGKDVEFIFKVAQDCRPLRAVLYLKKEPVLKTGLYNIVKRIFRVDAKKPFEGELVSRRVLFDSQEVKSGKYILRL